MPAAELAGPTAVAPSNELVGPPMSLKLPPQLDCTVLQRELSALRQACMQERNEPRGDCARFDHCPSCDAVRTKSGIYAAAGCKE